MGRQRLVTVSIAYALIVASFAGAIVALGPGVAAADHGGSTYAVGQDGQCVTEIHPLGDGTTTGPAYYDYEDYGSLGTTDIQETYLSQLYVYAGSDGTSLVFLHDRYGDGTGGGSVSFYFDGLPPAGEWTVEDDDYDGQDDRSGQDPVKDFDREAVHWMYGYNKTDGGVYVGLGGDGWTEVTIDPAFAEESWAWTERDPRWYEDGGYPNLGREGPREWIVRSRGNETTQLDMDQPVSIRTGACDAVSPAAALSAPANATTEADVTLNASNPDSPTSPISYEWDFQNDGSVDRTTDVPTVEHRYDETGEVTASVTVTDRFGNNDTASATIDVVNDTPPTAVAEVTETVGTGQEFTVDGSGSSDELEIDSYEWDFGDDSANESGETATHVYDAPGNYTVTLTVTDGSGKRDSDTANVTVTDATPPSAALSAPDEVARNETFDLDASASSDEDGSVVEYRWDLDGDGSPDRTTDADNATITHSFEEPGDHEVTVTVVDAAGNEDDASDTIHVVDETPPEAALSAPASAEAGTIVRLDASESEDNLEIDHYEWTFGDGDTDNTTSAIVHHAYESAGNYTPTVRVVDVDDNADTANATIEIEAAAGGNGTANDTAPTAAIDANTSASVGEQVTIDGTGSEDDGNLTDYQWAFGDGNTSSGPTVTHAYAGTGEYTVTLSVTDDAGQTDSATETIVVGDDEDPEVDFTVTGERETGQQLTFDASGSSDNYGIDEYAWHFDGDDEPDATGVTAKHTYYVAGNHTVTLRVTDRAGNPASNATTLNVTAAESSDGGSGDGDGSNGGSSGGSNGGSSGGSSGGGAPSSGGGGGGGGGGGSAPPNDDAKAAFNVTALTTNRSSVPVGGSVNVTATVANVGDAEGTVRLGPALERRPIELREVTLEPGESRNVTFTVPLEEPGVQTIDVGDRTTSVTVGNPEPDTAVTSLGIEEPTVAVGETATVIAEVTNEGDVAGEHTVALKVFGEVVDRAVVSVPPGETKRVRFEQHFAAPGNYSIAAGGHEATVRVAGEFEETADGTFSDVPDGTDRTTSLGFVAAGGLTLAAAAILVSRRL